MISTNSPVLPLGQIAPPSIQGQFGNLPMPMVGGVPGLPPPNMPGHLGNIPTMGGSLLESGHLTDPGQIAEY
jgi:hypothetical protein